MASEFQVAGGNAQAPFSLKVHRGDGMALLAMNWKQGTPPDDFVGFAIECKEPGDSEFKPLLNRIAFAYDQPAAEAVTGDRKFDSREAPFQKFRWIHFPPEPRDGRYEYRVTKRHMPSDNTLVDGTSLTLGLDLSQVTFDGLVDVGFTRNFA